MYVIDLPHLSVLKGPFGRRKQRKGVWMKGKKQKDKFNNLTLSRGSSMSFLLVSVLIKRFDTRNLYGFPTS